MVQSHMIQSKVSESLCHCLYVVSSVIALLKPVVFFMAYALGCLHCFWMVPEGLALSCNRTLSWVLGKPVVFFM
ncbi:hypothetical protein MUCCIDRAFT_155296, partial [Mucor lusitanicus CBS 277.49]